MKESAVRSAYAALQRAETLREVLNAINSHMRIDPQRRFSITLTLPPLEEDERFHSLNLRTTLAGPREAVLGELRAIEKLLLDLGVVSAIEVDPVPTLTEESGDGDQVPPAA